MLLFVGFFFFKQKTAYEMRISDWSSDVCSSDLVSSKMGDALKSAMTKNKVDLVLQPGATVSYQPAVDITNAVVTELNTLVPSAQIVPPAGWAPGQQQQQPTASGRTTPGRLKEVPEGNMSGGIVRGELGVRAGEGGLAPGPGTGREGGER